MIDVFITTKPGRSVLTERSLDSFISHYSSNMRLTVYVDGQYHGCLDKICDMADHVIISRKNDGLGPAINRCLSHIEAVNTYESHPDVGDRSNVSDFVVMCQDDLEYTAGWLDRLQRMYLFYEKRYNIGFASGLECVEHATKQELGGGMKLKQWIRASQMFARREYWMSMHPISKFDPETRRSRAKPNDGIGSGVDWWFIRNHPNSVDRSGKTCLVIPGLVRHIGYKYSTWLKGELPESEADKEAMNESP